MCKLYKYFYICGCAWVDPIDASTDGRFKNYYRDPEDLCEEAKERYKLWKQDIPCRKEHCSIINGATNLDRDCPKHRYQSQGQSFMSSSGFSRPQPPLKTTYTQPQLGRSLVPDSRAFPACQITLPSAFDPTSAMSALSIQNQSNVPAYSSPQSSLSQSTRTNVGNFSRSPPQPSHQASLLSHKAQPLPRSQQSSTADPKDQRKYAMRSKPVSLANMTPQEKSAHKNASNKKYYHKRKAEINRAKNDPENCRDILEKAERRIELRNASARTRRANQDPEKKDARQKRDRDRTKEKYRRDKEAKKDNSTNTNLTST
ncbi:hypothetical protein P280DRAFT_484103 [Massarina eburnea CBS 473.64]|uniref:Uncharacterized protein n=1 Tax=Massarina eburnea CBS 473.64 TaxID=1395130 RepID=A0A6A6RK86_9PLEO|nr:hypothetical protein P280DRAFT_484103 [Massarina eburnea CBS 473.64]